MKHYLVGMGQGPAQSPTFEEGLKHELWVMGEIKIFRVRAYLFRARPITNT